MEAGRFSVVGHLGGELQPSEPALEQSGDYSRDGIRCLAISGVPAGDGGSREVIWGADVSLVAGEETIENRILGDSAERRGNSGIACVARAIGESSAILQRDKFVHSLVSTVEFSHTAPLRNRISNVTSPILVADEITKFFDGVRALKAVNFELFSGEVHALVGENGAGKSTLIKIITGVVEADSGRLEIYGRSITHNSPNLARSFGVAAIYQQPSLFPHLTVAENIALSLETGSSWRRIDRRARHKKAQALLKRAGSSMDPERLVQSLSMPEQQILEIAKAIGANAKILIMDEPTASLTERETDSLFKVIAELKGQGVGIIYISHRLEEIFAVADRITVLRDGEALGTWNAEELDRGELIHLMVGRPVTDVFPKRHVEQGGIALEVRNLYSRESGVKNVSFAVRRGEILESLDCVGSGAHVSELAETIFWNHARRLRRDFCRQRAGSCCFAGRCDWLRHRLRPGRSPAARSQQNSRMPIKLPIPALRI